MNPACAGCFVSQPLSQRDRLVQASAPGHVAIVYATSKPTSYPCTALSMGMGTSVCNLKHSCKEGHARGGCAAQALTQYHLLLLVDGRVQAINRVSDKLVQEIALGGAVGGAPALGLTSDAAAGTVYLFTGVCSTVISTCLGSRSANQPCMICMEGGQCPPLYMST